ncbi:MAG: DUF72 domain-containing protein [Saprospiraceae bacterium]|nr:DUF72 domain-containing protein [Saprospiraceae bacterium]
MARFIEHRYLAAMEFGKLPSVEQVDFSFQDDPSENATVLQTRAGITTTPRIYLGATGYNMKAWVGQWYPAGTKSKDYLVEYGRQFNTIEHNTTHYRIPDSATVARWRDEVPTDFRYCPKIPQTISHARNLGLHGPEIQLFCEAIDGLDEKMGCCFMQLPPYFSVQDVPVLARFLEQFPCDRTPLAVEVRHESFFQKNTAAQDYFNLLADQGVATVITDVAGRRDVCHMRLTTDKVLIRFVGNSLHPTDHLRVEAWAERLRDWFVSGLREVYFFCHEPDNLLAPDLTVFAAATFQKAMPTAVLRGPEAYPPPPKQGTLF